jgi:L-cystine uptake protein TcyP (sodium:dicarboxylate symporter family)
LYSHPSSYPAYHNLSFAAIIVVVVVVVAAAAGGGGGCFCKSLFLYPPASFPLPLAPVIPAWPLPYTYI